MYIELHARSAFSFLEGASLPEELAAVCAQLGMPAMALLDTDGVYGAPRFHLAANKAKIKAHIGAEVTANFFFTTETPFAQGRLRHREDQSAIKNQQSKIAFLRAGACPERSRRVSPW